MVIWIDYTTGTERGQFLARFSGLFARLINFVLTFLRGFLLFESVLCMEAVECVLLREESGTSLLSP